MRRAAASLRVLALALLGLSSAARAAAQACVGAPAGRAVAAELRVGAGHAFREIGAVATVHAKALVLSAGYATRSYDVGDAGMHTLRGELAGELSIGWLRVCPLMGASRMTLDDLTIHLATVGAGAALPLQLGDGIRIVPFLQPSLAYSHSDFGAGSRQSVDPAVIAGAAVGSSRLKIGAAWERRFLDGVPAIWRGFLSMGWPRVERGH